MREGCCILRSVLSVIKHFLMIHMYCIVSAFPGKRLVFVFGLQSLSYDLFTDQSVSPGTFMFLMALVISLTNILLVLLWLFSLN